MYVGGIEVSHGKVVASSAIFVAEGSSLNQMPNPQFLVIAEEACRKVLDEEYARLSCETEEKF
jgi:hypothetical protein